jgi:hypothetical protein
MARSAPPVPAAARDAAVGADERGTSDDVPIMRYLERAAVDEGGAHLQAVVEDDDVGRAAGHERT